jgi:ketosteroid isomerase-like protein
MAGMRVGTIFLLSTAGFLSPAFAQGGTSDLARQIEGYVAQEIAGINAHDAVKATAFEADDTISMESGRPASVGRQAYIEGLKMAFKYAPAWHLRLIEQTVDIPHSREMAVYRSTYFQDSTMAGMPATQKVNYIAMFKKQKDGTWKIVWSVVSNIEKPHKL